MRVDSVLNIADLGGRVFLIENKIERNYGTKGVIYISIQDAQAVNEVFIVANNFTNNLGVYGSGSIYIKSVISESSSSGSCGSILFSGNKFISNSVLYRPGSIAKFECALNPNDVYSSIDELH